MQFFVPKKIELFLIMCSIIFSDHYP